MTRALGPLRSVVRWLLLAVVLAFLLTGFGITHYQVVGTLTFGLLDKALSFRIHEQLWIPLAVLLVLHICLSYLKSRKAKHEPD